MKNKINALLLSDLKIIIPNEQPRYLIEKNDDGNYIIKPIPIIYKLLYLLDHISKLLQHS